MCWHRTYCLQQEQLPVRDWRGDEMHAQRWLHASAGLSASHLRLLNPTFLACKGRGQRACLLARFPPPWDSESMSPVASELAGLLQNNLQGDKNSSFFQ